MNDGGDRILARRSSDASALRERPLSFHLSRVAIGIALAILTYALFPASPAIDLPVYEVGSEIGRAHV